MKAICKQAFTAGGRDYKPGDEMEISPTQFKKLAWHGYVCKPKDMPKDGTEEAADEGGSKSGDESSEEGDDVSESSESSTEEETE